MTSSSIPIDNRLKGIAWMLATMVCFIALDTMMKYAMQHYSLVQVTWARFFFATVFALLLIHRRFPQLVRSSVPGVQLTRSVLLMVTTGLFNAGIISLPLATATTIMFLSPILVTLLSIGLLGEHVGLRRWFGIAMGLSGAIVIIQPWHSQDSVFTTGVLFMLAAAFTNACYQIATRRVRFDDPLTSLLFTAGVGAAVTSFMLPGQWSTPDMLGWALMIGSGAMGCLGHLFLIWAFRAAPASVVAPFAYSSLIWSTLFGYVVWRELPGFNVLFGAALIAAAGLYIFFRERQLKAQEDELSS